MRLNRLFAVVVFLLSVTSLSAQTVIGIQAHNLIGGHIAPHYEGVFGDHFSFHLSAGLTPSRNIPGSRIARSLILEDPESSNFGNNGTYVKVSVTPELRGYISKNGAPDGFYLSLFGRYAYHNITVPYSIPFNQETIETQSGLRLQMFGLGLGLGYQFLFADDRIALDIFMGGGGGYAPVRLQIVDENLTDEAYEALYNSLDQDLKFNLLPENLPKFLTNNGLVVRAPFALPIFRAGVGLGFVIGG